MSSYTNANKRFAGQNISNFSPERKGGGRQFNSSVEPRLTNPQTYSSPEEALTNNSFAYRDEEGVKRRLKVSKVSGAEGTYFIAKDGTQASKGKPKLAVNSSKETRSTAARASTPDDFDEKLSGQKYQDINDKNKQAHHLLEVVEHGGAFIGRSPESKQNIIRQLNNRGFFTGDDRRQYVALTGNKMYNADGSMHTTGHLDEHQGGVHRNTTVASVVQKELLPTGEQFSQMTDDEVVDNLLMSGLAARLDVQNVKGINPQAIASTEKQLRRQTAKVIAMRRMNDTQTPSTLGMGA